MHSQILVLTHRHARTSAHTLTSPHGQEEELTTEAHVWIAPGASERAHTEEQLVPRGPTSAPGRRRAGGGQEPARPVSSQRQEGAPPTGNKPNAELIFNY